MKHWFTFTTIIFLVLSYYSYSQIGGMPPNYPNYFGLSNEGTDFWITAHPGDDNATDLDDIKIIIHSSFPANVVLEDARGQYRTELKVKVGQSNSVILSREWIISHSRSKSEPPKVDQVFGKEGFRVYSDYPISVFVVIDYISQKSAYLALPVSALGTDYLINSVPDYQDNVSLWGTSYFSVVAVHDQTEVETIIGGTPGTKTGNNFTIGQSKKYQLFKGDVLVVGSMGMGSDLTGSRIKSSKPVAVISGSFDAQIPAEICCSNYIIEQEFPTHSFGKTYIAAPFINKDSASYINLIPNATDADIKINDQSVASLTKSGGLSNEGWARVRLASANDAYVISSDKPFSASQIIANEPGDEQSPEMQNLIAYEHFTTMIDILPADSESNTSFTSHKFNLIYDATNSSAIPNDLQIAEFKNGNWEWQRLSQSSVNPGKKVTGNIAGRNYHIKELILQRKHFKLRANDPFMITQHGYSKNDSYAMPSYACTRYLSIEDEVDPLVQWSFDKDSSHFDVTIKDSASKIAFVYILKDESFNYINEIPEYFSGVTSILDFNINVEDPTTDSRIMLYVIDKSGRAVLTEINHFPERISVSEENIDYGLVKVKTKEIKTVYIKNQSDYSDLTIEDISLANSLEFKVLDSENIPLEFPLHPIDPGDSIEINIEFESSEFGIFADTLRIKGQEINKDFIILKAEASAPVIQTSDFEFGAVALNDKRNGQITIKNAGKFDLEIYSISQPSTQDIKFTNLPQLSIGNPYRLAPQQLFNLRFEFTPTEVKNHIEEIIITSNAEIEDSIGQITAVGVTSVEDSKYFSSDVKIFPNPAKNDFNLEFELKNPGYVTVRIISPDARVVTVPYSNINLSSGEQRLNIISSNLPSGYYYIELMIGDEMELIKFNIIR